MALLRSITLFIALWLAGGMAANTTAVTSTTSMLPPTTTTSFTKGSCWDVIDEVVDLSSGFKNMPGTRIGPDFVVEIEFNTEEAKSGWNGLFGLWKRKPNTASGIIDALDLRQIVCWQKPSKYELSCVFNAYPSSSAVSHSIHYSQGLHNMSVAIVGGTAVTVYFDGVEQATLTLNGDGFVNGVDDVFAVIGPTLWTSYPGSVSRFAMTNTDSICPIATTSSQTATTSSATTSSESTSVTSTASATTSSESTSVTSTASATTSSESTSVTSATTTATSATSMTATTSSMTETTSVTEGDSGWWWVSKGFSIELSWHCSILVLMAILAHIGSN